MNFKIKIQKPNGTMAEFYLERDVSKTESQGKSISDKLMIIEEIYSDLSSQTGMREVISIEEVI